MLSFSLSIALSLSRFLLPVFPDFSLALFLFPAKPPPYHLTLGSAIVESNVRNTTHVIYWPNRGRLRGGNGLRLPGILMPFGRGGAAVGLNLTGRNCEMHCRFLRFPGRPCDYIRSRNSVHYRKERYLERACGIIRNVYVKTPICRTHRVSGKL